MVVLLMFFSEGDLLCLSVCNRLQFGNKANTGLLEKKRNSKIRDIWDYKWRIKM